MLYKAHLGLRVMADNPAGTLSMPHDDIANLPSKHTGFRC
jgi:hypothetical protein